MPIPAVMEVPSSTAIEARLRLMTIVPTRLYRDSVGLALDQSESIDLIASFAEMCEALTSLDRLKPDVIILDVSVAETMELLSRLRDDGRDIKTLCLSAPEDFDEILLLTASGVSGFASANGRFDDLIFSIRNIVGGQFACDATVATALARHVAAKQAQKQNQTEIALTIREQQVLTHLAAGRANKIIAAKLCISLSTVKHHVHHALEKLGARNRTEAAVIARRAGLVD